MMHSVTHSVIPPGRGEFKQAAAQLHSELAITNLTADSRRVRQGDTFVAYPGEHVDGRRFIAEALTRGAQSVIWDPEGFQWPTQWPQVKQRSVPQLKERVSDIAAAVFGYPSAQLKVIGVTGTNGKSTCSHWLAQMIYRATGECALMGTLGNGLWPTLQESANTTPDAIECQRYLNQFVAQHCDHCVMEVSSHGLVQSRVTGVDFTGALFTNLTRDHLDYHGSMEAYAEAKALLFQAQGLKWAVINTDDDFGQVLFKRYQQHIPRMLGFSLKSSRDEQVMSAQNILLTPQGIEFDLCYQRERWSVKSGVLGRYNVANLLAVLGALNCLGIDLSQAIGWVSELQPPEGRLKRISLPQGAIAIVDYAHTPDALKQVLLTLKEILPVDSKLMCVFGCGGNRDRGKRALMGEVADTIADELIITNDNPRDENPQHIIDDILSGIQGSYQVIPDRQEAIHLALNQARQGDIVLIAGKGHEHYQEIKGIKHFFSDEETVHDWLKEGSTC